VVLSQNSTHFSSTLRILSSICWSRSVRVPKRKVDEMRGAPVDGDAGPAAPTKPC
jgi:hypothetical protein